MKKKVQKALGILTAFSMVLSMAGCGGNTSGETAQTGTDAAVESAAKDSPGEIEKIIVPYMLTMNAAEEKDMVQDAINELTRDKIGVEVELLCIDFASWSDQLNLMAVWIYLIAALCHLYLPMQTVVRLRNWMACWMNTEWELRSAWAIILNVAVLVRAFMEYLKSMPTATVPVL